MQTGERQRPSVGEVIASRAAWVNFLRTGESEAVKPIGLTTEGDKIVVRKVKTVTDGGGAPEEMGRIEVTGPDLEAALAWSKVAQEYVPYLGEDDSKPFEQLIGAIDSIDAIWLR